MAKKNNSSWMSKYNTPSKKEFMNWVTSQKNQFNPLLSRLNNQMSLLRPENSEAVKQYEAILGRIPGADQVSNAYKSKLGEFNSMLGNYDFAKGGKGVSDILGAVASGIGADPGVSADTAMTAGTVSGMGGQGGDVYSKAILGSVASNYAGLEADALRNNEDIRRSIMQNIGQTKDDWFMKRMDLGQMLGEVEGKKIASTPNPLDTANSLMQFEMAKRAFEQSRSGSGGSGGSGGTNTTQTPTPRPKGAGGASITGPAGGQGVWYNGQYSPSVSEWINNQSNPVADQRAPWWAKYGVDTTGKSSTPSNGGFGSQPGIKKSKKKKK